MRGLLFSVIFVMTAMAWGEQTEPDFDFFKSDAVAQVDQRIVALTTAKACIEAAMDKPTLKGCQKSLNEERREIKKDKRMKKGHK